MAVTSNTNVGGNKPNKPSSSNTAPGGITDTGVRGNESTATGSAQTVGKVDTSANQVQSGGSQQGSGSSAANAAAQKAAADVAKRERDEAARRKAELNKQKNQQLQQAKEQKKQTLVQEVSADDIADIDDSELDARAIEASKRRSSVAEDLWEPPAPRRNRQQNNQLATAPSTSTATMPQDSFVQTDMETLPDGRILDRVSGTVSDSVAENLAQTQNYDTPPVIPDVSIDEMLESAIPRTPSPFMPPSNAGVPRIPGVTVDDVERETSYRKAREDEPADMPEDISAEMVDEDMEEDMTGEGANPMPSGSTSDNDISDTSNAGSVDEAGVYHAPNQPMLNKNAEALPLDPFDRRMLGYEQYQEEQQRDLKRGYFPLSGTEKDENGVDHLSEKVSDWVLTLQSIYHFSDSNASVVWSMVQENMSMTIDRQGNFPYKPKSKEEGGETKLGLDDDFFCKSCEKMLANQLTTGFPFRFSREPMVFAGTPCFPSTIMPEWMFNILSESPDSPLHGMAYSEIVDIGVKEWKNFVYPSLLATGNPDQILVVEDFAYGIANSVSGLTPQDLNIPSRDVPFLSEVMAKTKVGNQQIADPDVRAVSGITEKRLSKAMDHLAEQTDTKYIRLEDGTIVESKSNVEYLPEALLKSFITGARVWSAMDPMLAGGAVMEKASGTLTHSIASKLSFIGNSDMAPTDHCYELIKTQMPMEYVEGYTRLAAAYGQSAFVEFCKEGKPPTKQNLKAFADRWGINKDPSGKAVEKLKRFQEWTTGGFTNIFGADWSFRNSDMNRLIDNFMLRQAEKKRLGETYVTPQQVESMLATNPGRFVTEMMSEMDGQRAFAQMRARTLGGNTILSEPVAQFMREHGITDATFAIFVNKYLVYGVRATERYIPMLNTIELLNFKARAKRNVKAQAAWDNEFITQEEIEERAWEELDNLEYSELLLSKSFKDALLLDVCNVATTFGKMMVLYAVISVLKFEPPDKEEKKYLWDEWVDGKSKVPWRMMWYLDDFCTWAAPAAMAIYAWQHEKGGPEVAWTMFKDGMCDTLLGLAPFDVLEVFELFNKDLQIAENREHEKDSLGNSIALEPANDLDFFTTQLAAAGLNRLSDVIVPRFIKDVFRMNLTGPNDYDHSYSTVYSEDPSDDPTAVESVKSFTEQQMRKIAAKDPIIGFILNLWSGYYTQGEDPITQKTGYMFHDQPISTITDATQLSNMDKWSLPRNDNGEIDLSDTEAIMWVVDDVRESLKYWGSDPYKAAANGMCIPNETRKYVFEYIQAEINALTNDFNIKKATKNYFSSDRNENQAMLNDYYNEIQAKKSALYKEKDLVWSKAIPSYPQKYARWKTDWQHIYKVDGKPATKIDYLLNGFMNMVGAGKETSMDIVPYGNFRNPFALVSAHGNDLYDSYDLQTPTIWWSSSYTDMDKIQEFYADVVVPDNSRFGGQKLLDVITDNGAVLGEPIYDENGTQIGHDVDWEIKPTMGLRGYTPLEEDGYEKLETEAADSKNLFTGSMGQAGLLMSDAEIKAAANGTYSPSYGYASRSYSGGGSSYNPRIYSNPRSVTADRAQGMNVRQPYKATSTYLRPGFSTKGSREAYKRQDI